MARQRRHAFLPVAFTQDVDRSDHGQQTWIVIIAMSSRRAAARARAHLLAAPTTRAQVLQPRSGASRHCQCGTHPIRQFSSSKCAYSRKSEYKESFGTRLRKALGDTKIKWYPIPVGLGIAFLGLGQLYRVQQREKRLKEKAEERGVNAHSTSVGTESNGDNDEVEGRPKRRKRIRPTGPW